MQEVAGVAWKDSPLGSALLSLASRLPGGERSSFAKPVDPAASALDPSTMDGAPRNCESITLSSSKL